MRSLGLNGNILVGKLQSLQNGLQLFGLDPKDWQISEAACGSLTIHHMYDPELTLKGQAYTQGHAWDWQDITIAAI